MSEEIKSKPQPKTDPLVRAVQAAYRKTDVAKLERLLAEQSRWKRKKTIASNKLASVREEIDALALELANQLVKAGTVLELGKDWAKGGQS